MPDFERTFRLLTGHDRMLSWQRRLLCDWFRRGQLPDEIDLPAGLGKTSVMVLWLMALAEQLGGRRAERLPLRYVHVVDGQSLVDQASVEAGRLARNLMLQPGLEWMRQALGLAGEGLAVSTLHGAHAGSSRWLANPAAPAIIVGTAEDAVSCLLFDGSGLSHRMRSVHAAMLGVDSLLVMDEIRLMPQAARLLSRLVGEGAATLWPSVPGIRRPVFLPMSVAGCGGGSVFRLEASDLEDEIIAQRLGAVRQLRMERIGTGGAGDEVLAARLADAAWRLACGGKDLPCPRTIVFCDDAGLARRVHDRLQEQQSDGRGQVADVLLLTSERRRLERHAVAEQLYRSGFLPGGGRPKMPVILVAASTVAESMDIEVDRMVCDLVPLDRMILRFGRLTRRAEAGAGRAVLVVDGMMFARGAGARMQRLEGAVRALERLGEDASPAAFMRLRTCAPDLCIQGSSPDPYASCPDVGPPGPVFCNPQEGAIPEEERGDEGLPSEILWRAHLPWRRGAAEPEVEDVAGYLAAAAPHPLEGLEAESSGLASLLVRRAGAVLKRSGSDTETGCGPDDAGAILLSRGGEFEASFSIGRLARMSVAELEGRIEGRMVLCAACLGGLDAEGRLDPAAGGQVPAADAGWPEIWRRCLGFRIRRVTGEGLCRLEQGWNRLFVMDLGWGADDSGDFLVIDVRRSVADGGEREARARGGQSERLPLVAVEVARLAEGLRLPDVPARALELAAAWLDLGRAHDLWQRAFSTRPGGVGDGGGRNGRERAGFHEGWGSLFGMMEQIMPTDLDSELRDLVHHLISRHAGAVPLRSADEVSAMAGGGRARRTRLERRYGQWGLAWLEALLWVAECRAASEDSPPCWRDGCADDIPVRKRGRA